MKKTLLITLLIIILASVFLLNKERGANLPNDYTQEVIELPSIKSDSEVYVKEEGIGHDYFDEQIEEYGDLARRFLPDESITFVKEFDVDNDPTSLEKIVGICGLWGNGCPHEILVIKDNMVIFRTSGLGIDDTGVGNGFILRWQETYKDPNGYIETRFEWNNDKFLPKNSEYVEY